MRDHLRAGIAIHNAGEHHAAHDAWEDRWLEVKRSVEDAPATIESVTDDTGAFPEAPTAAADERLLHGLIQFTAAVHHLQGDNPAGARGLAESGRAYLDPLPPEYRAVNVDDVREYLDEVVADPGGVESVLALTHDGEVLALDDLAFEAAAIAAGVIAEEYGYDEDVLERATEYARADLAAQETGSQFVALVMDFARDPDDRGIAFQRLRQHVQRRRRREEDVEGLF